MTSFNFVGFDTSTGETQYKQTSERKIIVNLRMASLDHSNNVQPNVEPSQNTRQHIKNILDSDNKSYPHAKNSIKELYRIIIDTDHDPGRKFLDQKKSSRSHCERSMV